MQAAKFTADTKTQAQALATSMKATSAAEERLRRATEQHKKEATELGVEHKNGVRQIRASSDLSVAAARAATMQLQGQVEGMMALLARVATPQVVHAPANFGSE